MTILMTLIMILDVCASFICYKGKHYKLAMLNAFAAGLLLSEILSTILES